MVEMLGHSQTKGRANREPKPRPTPARQSSTLPEGGGVDYIRRSLPLLWRRWIPACAGMVAEDNEFTLAKGRRDGQSAKSG